MKFDVTYADGFTRYIMVTEDGRAAMVDTQVGHAAWSETVETFLRLGPFFQVTEPIDGATLALLDTCLEDQAPLVEIDPQEVMARLRASMGHIFERGEDHEG